MANDERQTPLWLFDQLAGIFHFTLDVAAKRENTKCDQFYSKKENGLIQPWHGRVFCNPPYSHGQLIQWVAKARMREAKVAVLILPADTSTKWFPWDANALCFVSKRIAFDGLSSGARFPSVIAVFDHNRMGKLNQLGRLVIP